MGLVWGVERRLESNQHKDCATLAAGYITGSPWDFDSPEDLAATIPDMAQPCAMNSCCSCMPRAHLGLRLWHVQRGVHMCLGADDTPRAAGPTASTPPPYALVCHSLGPLLEVAAQGKHCVVTQGPLQPGAAPCMLQQHARLHASYMHQRIVWSSRSKDMVARKCQSTYTCGEG